MGTVVCALDLSAGSEAVVDRAASLAAADGSALVLVHVFQVPALSFLGVPQPGNDVRAELAAKANAELRRLATEAETAHAVHAEAQVIEGVPWKQIIGLALDRSADVIVLGAHGENRLSEPVFGSVAERVVRHAPCSVMVTRSRPSARVA